MLQNINYIFSPYELIVVASWVIFSLHHATIMRCLIVFTTKSGTLLVNRLAQLLEPWMPILRAWV